MKFLNKKCHLADYAFEKWENKSSRLSVITKTVTRRYGHPLSVVFLSILELFIETTISFDGILQPRRASNHKKWQNERRKSKEILL